MRVSSAERAKEAFQVDKKANAVATAASKQANALLKEKRYSEARKTIAELIDTVEHSIYSLTPSKSDVVVATVPQLGDDAPIILDKETMWEIGNVLRRRPTELLNLPSVRSRLSRQRRLQFMEEGRMKLVDENENIIKNAVVHNVEKLSESTDDGGRPSLLINPLSSIDWIATHKKEMKILTIGSRSESELFCLYAAGYDPANIEAVDLISYTPLIKAGDAHKLDFPDNSFDIVIAGWVLAYSENPHIMAAEIMRVAKPHAYVAAGCAYTPPGRGKSSGTGTNIIGTRFSSIDDITKLFEPRLARVLFQSPIERERAIGSAALATVVQLEGEGLPKAAADVPEAASAVSVPAGKNPVAAELNALKKRLSAYANTSIQHATQLTRKGEYARAEEVLRSVNELFPEEKRHLSVYGSTLAALGRYADAEPVFRRLVAADETVAQSKYLLADVLGAQGRHLEAAEVLEKADGSDREGRRIQTHRNLAGQFTPELCAIRDKAVALHQGSAPLSDVQKRVLAELKETGIAQTSFSELFGDRDAVWKEAESDFARFADHAETKALVERISQAKDFKDDPELAKLFKPSVVNYRKFFGDLTIKSPVARIYCSDEILGIANGYNDMASKIRNMHMWINPPLHPDNVNGRKGSQLWHRDQEDSRILKCFVYFSDIDEASGATDFIKNSGVDCTGLKDSVIPYPNSSGYPAEALFNARIQKEDFVRADGPKGTIVFLDTNGFHRGGFVRERARHIAMCTFLRPISSYVDQNTKLDATSEELALLSPVASFGIA